MGTALFRVDGSSHLGIGHIMRCLAFARGLGKVGTGAVFVSRDYARDITGIIRRYGYESRVIPADCSFDEDATLTLKHADSHGAGLIVTDLSNPEVLERLADYGGYLKRLKDSGGFMVSIDHRNELIFPSDILINPTYGAEKMNYDFKQSTRFLLGTAYFIFRQEFIDAAGLSREIRKEARNVLITIGGTDPLNLTAKVTMALSGLSKVAGLSLHIVLGINYPDAARRELEESLQNFRGEYEFLRGSDNMADLMLWSDLAITGAGLTKYETAVTGTPSIVISQEAHHARAMERFEKEETAWHLGLNSQVSDKDISGVTARILEDHALRTKMSKNGKKLVDGRGVERIISEIPREVLAS